jgi:hypothetical protein
MTVPSTITSTATQGLNYFDFSNPQTLSLWVLVGLVLILVVKRLWDTYKDISGQRVIEHDGGILTITRVNNDAIADKTLSVANRSYVIDHAPYRIVTTLGVHLTLWICDKITGKTIGLNDAVFKSMSAEEQNEIIRAIPERELGTVHTENNLMMYIICVVAGAGLMMMVAKGLGWF